MADKFKPDDYGLVLLKRSKKINVPAFADIIGEVHGKRVDRIHEKQQRGSGGKLGDYTNNYPVYFQGQKFSSYSSFKRFIGRSGRVDLFLTGDFKADFSKFRALKTRATFRVFGKNRKKLRSFRERYGDDVLDFSKKEVAEINKRVSKRIAKLMSND